MNLTPEVMLGISVGASVVASVFVTCVGFCCRRGDLRDLKKQVDGLQRQYNEFVTPVVAIPSSAATAATPTSFQNKYVVPIPSAPPATSFHRSAAV